jgi:predicted transcriptional regulator of viral defense system
MSKPGPTQEQRAIALLKQKGIVRPREFSQAGVTAATLARMRKKGAVLRLGRGLYQLADADLDISHSLAEAAKLVPKGTICLASALAYHGLTDTIPSRIWIAIGPKDRKPNITHPPLQIVRFGPKVLHTGIDEHVVEGVPVRIYSAAKTVVDLFRYKQSQGKRFKKSTGLNLAIEGLKEALKQRKATPSAIASFAREAGVWKTVEPYLDALTVHA